MKCLTTLTMNHIVGSNIFNDRWSYVYQIRKFLIILSYTSYPILIIHSPVLYQNDRIDVQHQDFQNNLIVW